MNKVSTVSEAEVMQLHAQICAGLADPKRIMILYELVSGPRNVTEIAAALGVPQPQVSRHLKVLRDRGMVTAERHGATVVYTAADERVIQALDLLRQVLADKLRSQAALAATVTSAGE
jgi:DNA-binding transcriptional ArsR family regulator